MKNNGVSEIHEKNVISGILLKPELFEEVAAKLIPEDFLNIEYKRIFELCKNIFAEDGNLSLTKVFDEISKNNANEKVVQMLDSTFDYIDFSFSVEKMKEESKKRKLFSVNEELEKLLENGEFGIGEIEKIYQKAFENFETIEDEEKEDMFENMFDTIVERKRKHENGETLIEIDFGYSSLNLLTNGLHRGELVILAARPGMGKTAFMLNMAIRQLKAGKSILIFSLEMSKELLIERMISIFAGISLQKLRWGNLNEMEFNEVVKALDFLKGKQENLVILDKSDIKIDEIKAEIRKRKKKKNIDVVYIDYLQLINSASTYNNKNIEVGEVSRISKVMARELDVAVVMLAQLSREVEKRSDKRPVLSDLRDSGEIEQNADLVLFLYREAYYNHGENVNEDVEVILSKHRNGPLGTINMAFLKENLNFLEYDKEG